MVAIEQQLRAILEPLIVGKTRPAGQCCCGYLKWPESTATRLYVWDHDQHISYAWSVVMCANGKKTGSVSLSEFVDDLKLKELFESVGGRLGYRP